VGETWVWVAWDGMEWGNMMFTQLISKHSYQSTRLSSVQFSQVGSTSMTIIGYNNDNNDNNDGDGAMKRCLCCRWENKTGK